MIAARILPQAEVGRASAVVSAFILVAGATQLNLGVGLMRWLPTSGRHAADLVWRATAVVLPLSGAVGLVYVLLAPALPETAAGRAPLAVGIAVFILATAGWGMFVVHDFILVAIQRTVVGTVGFLGPTAVAHLGTAAARRRAMLLFLPALGVGALVTEPVLAIFGSGYADAATVLRVLLLGLAFRLVVVHELGVRQALGQAMGFARLQLVSTLIVLLAVIVLPARPAAGLGEALLPVAWGYLIVQVACAAGLLALPLVRARLLRTAK